MACSSIVDARERWRGQGRLARVRAPTRGLAFDLPGLLFLAQRRRLLAVPGGLLLLRFDRSSIPSRAPSSPPQQVCSANPRIAPRIPCRCSSGPCRWRPRGGSAPYNNERCPVSDGGLPCWHRFRRLQSAADHDRRDVGASTAGRTGRLPTDSGAAEDRRARRQPDSRPRASRDAGVSGAAAEEARRADGYAWEVVNAGVSGDTSAGGTASGWTGRSSSATSGC